MLLLIVQLCNFNPHLIDVFSTILSSLMYDYETYDLKL